MQSPKYPSEFTPIIDKLIKYNWKLIKSNSNQIIFKNKENNYDYFDITFNSSHVRIAIPFKSVPNTYVTKFNSYSNACNYINMYIDNYEL